MSLLSFFFKTLLNFKFFFSVLNFNKLLGSLFTYLYIYLLKDIINVGFILIIFFTQIYSILILSVPHSKRLRNFTLHYSLYILLALGLFYKHSVLNDHLHTNFTELVNHMLLLSFNNRDIEASLNFLTDTTSFEGKSFDLIIYLNYVYQVYFLNTNN